MIIVNFADFFIKPAETGAVGDNYFLDDLKINNLARVIC